MSYKAKKLINDPNVVVTEFIEGLVETYPGLQYLDGFPQIKVVLRADVYGKTYDKVAVISGGGSGHEPAHAGFVGEGMLTAAICGDVFTSPPVDSILAGIRAVTGPMGCLLIVKNYTGDRLNFGLAAEQAKSEGYKVETVIVGDDCALPPPRGVAGRRGLAGTILVHKVAGAAAAVGLSLAQVAAEAKRASERVGTMGVALSVCTLPGEVPSDRLGPQHMELGLGIHGEPGAAIAEIQPVDVVVSHVLSQILSPETQYVPITRGSRVALMINGLGATPLMELMLAAGKAVPQLQLEHGLAVDRVYTGSFMTSLDMAGFSISIMKADPAILLRLDAPTKAPSWPVGAEGDRPPAKIPVPVPPSRSKTNEEAFSQPQELNEQGSILECAIEAAANEIINLREKLNDWDSKVGDGDCGSTMFRGATAILEDMKKCYPLNDVAETVNEIGATIGSVMGGTSGILYVMFCKAAYASLKGSPVIGSMQWANALESSIAAVSKYGGASAGYRTMLDALIPASTVLKARLRAGDDPLTAFSLSSEAALSGAESTKHMQAQAGRSSYVSPDMLASVPDPGAMAAAAWYRAAALAIEPEEVRKGMETPSSSSSYMILSSSLRHHTLEFLIYSSLKLSLQPIVKYTALSLFADRFLPTLRRKISWNHWLLDPLRESNLQLFALISIWISSKIHNSRPLSVKSLKSLGDNVISDQHFTTRDFAEAELVFMEVLGFNIGASNVAFVFLEDFVIHFRELSKAGELLSVPVCMEIMDLLYETEETSVLFNSPHSLAPSILVVAYIISVPKQQWEFPLLPWVKFVTSYDEEYILGIVQSILEHILKPEKDQKTNTGISK